MFAAAVVATGLECALEVIRVAQPTEAHASRLRGSAHLIASVEDVRLVPVIGAFVWDDDELLALVTERPPGESLATLLSRDGPLPPALALALVCEVASVLAKAHGKRVVHGNLTPRSIWVEQHEAGVSVRVLGLGTWWLRRLAPPPAEERSPYDAPEITRDVEPTAAADVFALGAIARACFERKATLTGGGAGDLGLYAGQLQLLARAMDVRPEQRPSMTELASLASAPAETRKPSEVDRDVQITVYRPKVIAPDQWYELLAFAHLGEKRADEPASAPEPLEVVKELARSELGASAAGYRATTQDALEGLPRGGEVTFTPAVPGVEFVPPSCRFVWNESVHEERFHFRAAGAEDGAQLRGTLSVYLGLLLIADVHLVLSVNAAAGEKNAKAATPEKAVSTASAYRKIFASYARTDAEIVEHFRLIAQTLGDRYLVDVQDIRAGEVWSERIPELIEQAEIFQLFWSSRSMQSEYVRQEWEYALSLGRKEFVRPVYWEHPMPRDPVRGLPPPELDRLSFAQFGGRPGLRVTPLVAPQPVASSDSQVVDAVDEVTRREAREHLEAVTRQEALREGAREAARQEAEHRARMEALAQQQRHEMQLSTPRRRGSLARVASAAALVLFVGLGGYVYTGHVSQRDAQTEEMRREAERALAELARLQEEVRVSTNRVQALKAALASATEDSARVRLQGELARAQEQMQDSESRFRAAGGSPSPARPKSPAKVLSDPSNARR